MIYIFRLGKNHCPLVSLEEYKYVIKRNKIPKYITDNIEFFLIILIKKILIILIKKVLMKKTILSRFCVIGFVRKRYINLKIRFLKYLKNQSNIFFTYFKMSPEYYQKNKERLRKEAQERYQNLIKDEKQRAAKCRRNYYITHKKITARSLSKVSIDRKAIKKRHRISSSGIVRIIYFSLIYQIRKFLFLLILFF